MFIFEILFMFLAIYIIYRFGSGRIQKCYTSLDEVFIAQFAPTTTQDIARYVKCTNLKDYKVNIYIDFTLNNVRGTKNLHKIHKRKLNLYQKVLSNLVEGFKNGQNTPINVYGFGDIETQDNEVFCMSSYRPCQTAQEAAECYISTVATVEMSGPRCFVPAIRHAMDQANTFGKHITFIITNGLPENVAKNFEAVVDSSWHDLIVIIIGVGSGPWQGISQVTRFTQMKRVSNASYLLLDHYTNEIEFLKNIVLTANSFDVDFTKDKLKMESSHLDSDKNR